MSRRLPTLCSTLLVGTVALAACTGDPSAEPVTVATSRPTAGAGGPGRSVRPFERFASCDELLSYVRAEALERVTPWGLDTGGWWGMDDAAESAGGATTTAAGAAAPSGGEDGRSSSTNTQEVGVDEGDTVETDGRYVYAVQNGTLHVVDAIAGTAVGRLDLGPANHQLLLDADRLTIVSSGWSGTGPVPVDAARVVAWPTGGAGATVLRVVGVGDPARPVVASETELEGTAVATRAADGQVRVVMHTRFADRLPFVHPNQGDDETAEKALEHNKAVIQQSPIEDWLPRIITTDANGTRSPARQALACEEIGRPAEFSGLGLTWVATTNPAAAASASGSAGVVADGEMVYASATRLYVATTRWAQPEGDVAPNRPEPVTTAIHAFDLGATGEAAYLASGTVLGQLLNQFSMSEHEAVLRVAATELDQGFGRPSESAVRLLRIEGDRLVEIGAVGGLGRTEQVRAVRFLGELAYVVTFRQTDPLYVLDLRDPIAPKRAGELKIPGYSAYLHPVGDGMLLGVGQDATADGRTLGAQLSLFDVRDPAAPARLSTLGIGGQTAAEFDHHAFLWWPATGQAVVTVQDYDTGKEEPKMTALVARVGTGQLSPQGSVTHPRLPGAYPVPVDRALVVEGRLVTVSANGVLVSDLASLGQLAWVPFTA